MDILAYQKFADLAGLRQCASWDTLPRIPQAGANWRKPAPDLIGNWRTREIENEK